MRHCPLLFSDRQRLGAAGVGTVRLEVLCCRVMGLSDVTTESVVAAIAGYDDLGGDRDRALGLCAAWACQDFGGAHSGGTARNLRLSGRECHPLPQY
jgi:hypothetical protein